MGWGRTRVGRKICEGADREGVCERVSKIKGYVVKSEGVSEGTYQ